MLQGCFVSGTGRLHKVDDVVKDSYSVSLILPHMTAIYLVSTLDFLNTDWFLIFFVP